VRVTLTGKYFFTWQVGVGVNRQIVCRKGFEMAYQISSWYTDDLINRIKEGDANVEASFSDRTAMDKSGINDARVISFCKHFGIALSRMQLRALKIPNSLSSLTTVAWMNYYFKLVAENPPNAAEELHLEPVKKKDIYGRSTVSTCRLMVIWPSPFDWSCFWTFGAVCSITSRSESLNSAVASATCVPACRSCAASSLI
jgi:hypothetical protein